MLRRFASAGLRGLRAGQGRPFALALLALAVAALALLPDGPLPALRLALFDSYQQSMPRPRQSNPVLIVGIDEASLKAYGQWPWPRTRLAALIDRASAGKPLAIGLDIIMPEADLTSPEALAASLPQQQGALARALVQLPPHDEVLAASLRRAAVVLGVAGFDVAAPGTTDAVRSWPLRVAGGDALPLVRRFPQVLASLPALQQASSGQALLSADLEQGIVRRVPLIGAIGDTLLPSLSLELLRVATGAGPIGVTLDGPRVASVTVADLTVPTQANGSVWVHFSRPEPHRTLSARDLMEGRFAPEALENKVVIVALTGLGLIDNKTTARGDFLPGVEVHAQLIESFLEQRFLRRPAALRWIEPLLLGVLGLSMVWAAPRFGPRFASVLSLPMTAALFSAGALLFQRAGLLLDVATVFCALAVLFVSLMASMSMAAVRERKQSERALRVAREAAARTAGELGAARRIQMASLPVAATAFPGETRFSVDALLEPAREVGGDLYDVFMLDARHLFFLIGDVSGKGLPASLFMVVAKALSKSIALRGTDGVAAIMNQANVELGRENPEMLFVTGVFGILDADSGEVALCNAGHDAPRRLFPDGRIETLPGADGPPLCVLDGFDYPLRHYQLTPGECLCLTTDGIGEAMDAAGELFGNARLNQVLSQVATTQQLAPSRVVHAVRERVRLHVADAEASDDLTLLVLCWHGQAPGTHSDAARRGDIAQAAR